VCERCGANDAVPPEQLDGVRHAVAAATGLRARFSHFPIVGVCGDCTVGAPARHHSVIDGEPA
jgi:Fur family ferric uptake transcriptional regulator